MLFNYKIAACAALAVGALGMWVPKLFSSEPAPVDDYAVAPDDPTGGAFVDGFEPEEGPSAAPLSDLGPAPDASRLAVAPTLAGEPSAPGSSLDTREVLDLVAQLRGGASPRPQQEPAPAASGGATLPDAGGRPDRYEPLGIDVELFAREHALTGVLVGEASCAVLGEEVVSVGESFAEGRARLISVGPDHVLVELGGETVRLGLPPFKPRPPERRDELSDPDA